MTPAKLFSVETNRPGCVERPVMVVADSVAEAAALASEERPDAEIVKITYAGEVDIIEGQMPPIPVFLLSPEPGRPGAAPVTVAARTVARAVEMAVAARVDFEPAGAEHIGTISAMPLDCPALVYEAPTGASASFEAAADRQTPGASSEREVMAQLQAMPRQVADLHRAAAALAGHPNPGPLLEKMTGVLRRRADAVSGIAESEGPAPPSHTLTPAALSRLDAVVDGYRQAPRTAADIRAEIYGLPPYTAKLKHGRNQSGEPGPCEPDCRKCALQSELLGALGTENEDDLVPAVEAPSEEEQRANATAESRMDRRMAAADRHVPPTIESTNDAAKLANLLLGFRGAIARALGTLESDSDDTMIRRAAWLREEAARLTAPFVPNAAQARERIGQQPTDQTAEECGVNALKWAAAFCEANPHPGPAALRALMAGWFALAIQRALDLAGRARGAGEACAFCGNNQPDPRHRDDVVRCWSRSRRQDVEAWCERANAQLIASGGAHADACDHAGPLNEWSDGSRFSCVSCGRFVAGSSDGRAQLRQARGGIEAAFSASTGHLGAPPQVEAQPSAHQRAVIDQARWLAGLGPQERARAVELPPTQAVREPKPGDVSDPNALNRREILAIIADMRKALVERRLAISDLEQQLAAERGAHRAALAATKASDGIAKDLARLLDAAQAMAVHPPLPQELDTTALDALTRSMAEALGCEVHPITVQERVLALVAQGAAHRAMISGLARAAARYEQTGLMVRGDGSLWDDDMRNALAAAREAGLAPPQAPLDHSAARACWVPPDAVVLTDADARAYREFQRASIAMEDAHRAYADRQREHGAAMVTLGRAAAASGRAAGATEPAK